MSRICTNPDHPAKRHGHYGFGGAHWCSDFASPLLSEGNMGVIERGRIVVYEKAAPTLTEPTLAEYRADLRARVEALRDEAGRNEHASDLANYETATFEYRAEREVLEKVLDLIDGSRDERLRLAP